jgi:hypothetical protein
MTKGFVLTDDDRGGLSRDARRYAGGSDAMLLERRELSSTAGWSENLLGEAGRSRAMRKDWLEGMQARSSINQAALKARMGPSSAFIDRVGDDVAHEANYMDHVVNPPHMAMDDESALAEAVISRVRGDGYNRVNEEIERRYSALERVLESSPVEKAFSLRSMDPGAFLPRSGSVVSPDEVMDAFASIRRGSSKDVSGADYEQLLGNRRSSGAIEGSRSFRPSHPFLGLRPPEKHHAYTTQDKSAPSVVYDIPGAALGGGRQVPRNILDGNEKSLGHFQPRPGPHRAAIASQFLPQLDFPVANEWNPDPSKTVSAHSRLSDQFSVARK